MTEGERTFEEILAEIQCGSVGGASATQEMKASAFSRTSGWGLLQVLGQEACFKIRCSLARAAKYITMEDAQTLQEGKPWREKEETEEETPTKKPQIDS
ncbi:UNVERIFIED_CONTAM: hypothetical protein Slati_3695800 [Sesamum latifolium]|uniref:Uncharacterized protein n=1 Tax=Sesamum latifolium TaxID=2727402 RepID=A0AAW2U5Q0_9LAMI